MLSSRLLDSHSKEADLSWMTCSSAFPSNSFECSTSAAAADAMSRFSSSLAKDADRLSDASSPGGPVATLA